MKQLRRKPLKDFLKQVKPPERELVFILQDVQDPVNVGSAFRIADACRVKELILTGISARTVTSDSSVKSREAKHRRVKWRYVRSRQQTQLYRSKQQAIRVVALEVTAQSIRYDEADYPEKICLIVGHEDHGVTKRTLAACDMRQFFFRCMGRVHR